VPEARGGRHPLMCTIRSVLGSVKARTFATAGAGEGERSQGKLPQGQPPQMNHGGPGPAARSMSGSAYVSMLIASAARPPSSARAALPPRESEPYLRPAP
jgi:hypothetical protein